MKTAITPTTSPAAESALSATLARFMAKVTIQPNGGCWLWNGAHAGGGYGSFHFNGRLTTAHRASYKMLIGDVADGLYVCHKCDVRLCVNPDHLFLGTQKENMQDCLHKGRYSRAATFSGIAHPRPHRKLIDADIVAILALKGSALMQKDVAARFGVSPTIIRHIWNGETFHYITRLALRHPERT